VRLIIGVKGRPAPQGSKDLGSAGQLIEHSAYLPAWRVAVKVGAYMAYQAYNIQNAALPLFPAGTPVVIERCTFYLESEQCRAEGTDLPLGTPDIDKLLRSTLDALGGQKRGSARLFADDSQVVRIRDLSKERPGAELGGWNHSGALIIVSDGRD
jgi:Holliday junction resolvase RusA-like endonuclease